MANTRIIRNPKHNLTLTANDFVDYLKKAELDEVKEILNHVRKLSEYWSYWGYYDKNKIAALQNAVDTLQQDNIFETVAKLLNEHGWADTHPDINILNCLFKKVKGYNDKVELSLDNLKDLNDVLSNILIVNQEEKRLQSIDDQALRSEKELLKMLESIVRKQEELSESKIHIEKLEIASDGIELQRNEVDKLISELRNIEQDTIKRQQDFLLLSQEKKQCEDELEKARTTLLILDPVIDVNKLGQANEIAQTAVKTFFMEEKQAEERKRELETISSSEKKKYARGKTQQLDNAKNEKIEQEDEVKRARNKEIEDICKKNDEEKTQRQAVKNVLTTLLSIKQKEMSKDNHHQEMQNKNVKNNSSSQTVHNNSDNITIAHQDVTNASTDSAEISIKQEIKSDETSPSQLQEGELTSSEISVDTKKRFNDARKEIEFKFKLKLPSLQANSMFKKEVQPPVTQVSENDEKVEHAAFVL